MYNTAAFKALRNRTGFKLTKVVILTTKHNAKCPQEYKYMLNNVCGLTH